MTFEEWLEDFVVRMDREGIAEVSSLEACSEYEIAAVEAEFGLRLPAQYRKVLMRFGRGAGKLIDEKEMDFYLPAVVLLNRRVREGRSVVAIPEGAFAVRGRYDEQVEFVLDSRGGEESRIWYVGDGGEPPVPFYASFESWFETLFDDAAPGARAARERLKR